MQLNNKIIIAAAGSGKTTELVKTAILNGKERILITTFTIDNSEEIRKKFFQELGYIPTNVKIQTWFSFLLHECVRPYQNVLYDKKRIENIEFVSGQSSQWIVKSDIERYYFKSGNRIYTDKICDFICRVNKESKGAVISRLEGLYDIIMIDEIQDLAGPDLDLLYLLLTTNLKTIMVGDNRQATYFTNNARKNKRFKGEHIFELFKNWESEGLCLIEYRQECRRSNQLICDMADSLYPDMPKTISLNDNVTGHDGLFFIRTKDVQSYVEMYSPKILRYNKVTKTLDNLHALNFGKSKGLTFDRVLILCNGPINKYLKTGNVEAVSKTKAGFYVALTRARYSVTFVTDEKKVLNPFLQEYIF
ncbi:UvrD-helicase domain-containing protein [Cytobacillus solani]|uniref:Uncharacterized protein n=1 Tax=Cytobacillus solani TaxID=1637975 RepID=A0A0Q3QU19_9BACI|nr:UvrD-helicase domain-containing protein [Cytobacillus solani]KQL21230.1 hypothetical protein AN957_23460 [Cytobacillus solani]